MKTNNLYNQSDCGQDSKNSLTFNLQKNKPGYKQTVTFITFFMGTNLFIPRQLYQIKH